MHDRVQPYLLAAIMTLTAASGCSVYQNPDTEMQRMQTADPAADVRAAIKYLDLQFIGLGGYAGRVPGDALAEKFSATYGVKFVEGTNCTDRPPTYSRLIGGVIKYAGRYNTLLARHLERSNPRTSHKPNGIK